MDKQRIIATADLFELLSLAFSFPTSALAEGIVSGTYWEDFKTCLSELNWSTSIDVPVFTTSSDALYQDMRKEYSRLYLSPGRLAVIYPYESAFLFAKTGRKGFPTLFVNPITLDVERQMREAGALPEDNRKEPVDSVGKECDFLRIIYTLAVAAEHEGDCTQAACWIKQAETFRREHIDLWLPSFLEMTREKSRSSAYCMLAQMALEGLQATKT